MMTTQQHLPLCSHECAGAEPGCVVGSSGGMHLYNYYEGMDTSKSCGEEITFMKSGQATIINADTDYTVRLVVSLNSPGVPLHCIA
jgi:hypothetical protein